MTAEFPIRVRMAIRRRADYRCEVCAKNLGAASASTAQVHHRRARGMGGSTDPMSRNVTNGLLTCIPCHARIESEREWALDRGFLVRQGHNPASVPVRLWNAHPVLLTHDGGYGRVEPEDAA